MNDIVEKVLQASGFDSLNPPQQAALDSGLLEGKSIVVAAPTASGKTLIAEMAALNTIMKQGKKVIYIVPLKALASEKYDDFREKYESLGLRVAISIGDLDSTDPWLANYDLVIVTSEKLDSLLRHGVPWIESVGLVIADEVHLLNDPGRGPTLDIVLTRLRQISDPMILALSATINNHKELADWLDAKPLKSDYRPVKLYRGVYYDNEVAFVPKRKMELESDNPLNALIGNTLDKEKQALVFVSTRKSTEVAANNLGTEIEKRLSDEERGKLAKLSDEVLSVASHHTKQCEILSECIKMGSAFHHAGLMAKQRKIVEDSFRQGLIKVITSTPTLAFGVNLPAFRTIIRDLKRYASFGMDYLPILEVCQMQGRAGRPKYDDEGEAIVIAKNKAEAKYAWDNYINGEPEKITSKLGAEPVLRTHVLALISSGMTPTRKDLLDFFSKTFYAFQYKDLTELDAILGRVITMLNNFKLITTKDNEIEDLTQTEFKSAASMFEDTSMELIPTRMGRRVSELYLDPLTAHELMKGLQEAEGKGVLDVFPLLHLISNTVEMKPLVSLRKSDHEMIDEVIRKQGNKILGKIPGEWEIDYDDFMRSIKTARVFQAWAEELGEDRILEGFGVTPGELRARLSNSDWLLYAASEVALLLGLKDILSSIKKTRLRIKYGIREELLPLVKLKGIGRVRARMLYRNGMKRLSDLKKASPQQMERVVGAKVAESIKAQL
jgi:helicase